MNPTTTPAPAPKKHRVQLFPEMNAEVRVTKGGEYGQRFAHITYLPKPNPPTGRWLRKQEPFTVAVPVQMLGLSAGKDAWMRGIEVKCLDCGTWTKASAMECELCEKCYEAALDENDCADGRS